MLILFDHGTPRGLARLLSGHTVVTARAKGWDRLSNGSLLDVAEKAGFDLFLSTDSGIRYQQNLAQRKIAILILTGSTKWTRVRLQAHRIEAAVTAAAAGSYNEIEIPFDDSASR
jgi:hypothetical protein